MFFTPLFFAVFGSGIRDGQKSGCGIRDKNPDPKHCSLLVFRIRLAVGIDLPRLYLDPDPILTKSKKNIHILPKIRILNLTKMLLYGTVPLRNQFTIKVPVLVPVPWQEKKP